VKNTVTAVVTRAVIFAGAAAVVTLSSMPRSPRFLCPRSHPAPLGGTIFVCRHDSAMQIIELHPPTNYSWLYTGLAVNTRGQRYKFQTTVDGVTGVAVREVIGSTFWRQVTVPQALKVAARKAVRAAQRTARRQERGRDFTPLTDKSSCAKDMRKREHRAGKLNS
jgi:hypothetical protein